MTEEIEMHQAYCWDCDKCGRESIARVIVQPVSKDEIRRAREASNDQNKEIPEEFLEDDGNMMYFYKLLQPSSVTCKYCGSEYKCRYNALGR